MVCFKENIDNCNACMSFNKCSFMDEHCAKVLEHNAIMQAIEAYKIEGK